MINKNEVESKNERQVKMNQKDFNTKAAFTLAETLITLTILGVVAAITVPSLINKYTETANRTKVKKAMAAYEKALNQMIIDNDIKGAISAAEGFRTADNCSGSSPYFKAIKYAQKNNADNLCRFQTSDRVWWDITDIEHPIIALNEEDLDNTNAEKRFVLVGHLEDGILRINDRGFETTDPNKTYLTKLYNFINNTEGTSGGGTPSIFASCNNTYPCEVTYDCSTTSEPSKTCTAKQSKPVTFTTSAYDDSIGYGCSSDSATCAALKAKSATGGPFMTTNIGRKIPGNNAEAECKKLGDNYRVATTAELQQMYSAGTLKCYDGSTHCDFWASDETSSGSIGVNFDANYGYVYDYDELTSYDNLQVLCLGNE